MEPIVKIMIQEIEKCTKLSEFLDVFESRLSEKHISMFLEILKEFNITEPEIKDMIEKNLVHFLDQMKIVCFHVITTFFHGTKKEFFITHVKWFYLIFVYFALKKMVNQEIIVWPNFKVNLNIQKMFIDVLMKYDRELRTEFRTMMTLITSSPLCMLKGIGGVPEYI